MEVELIVVVGERHITSREVDLYHGSDRLSFFRNSNMGGGRIFVFILISRKTNLEFRVLPSYTR